MIHSHASHCDTGEGCITCGDVAVESRVVSVDRGTALAVCEDPAGERSEVDVALVEPLTVGDVVLVHAGAALARIEAG